MIKHNCALSQSKEFHLCLTRTWNLFLLQKTFFSLWIQINSLLFSITFAKGTDKFFAKKSSLFFYLILPCVRAFDSCMNVALFSTY